MFNKKTTKKATTPASVVKIVTLPAVVRYGGFCMLYDILLINDFLSIVQNLALTFWSYAHCG